MKLQLIIRERATYILNFLKLHHHCTNNIYGDLNISSYKYLYHISSYKYLYNMCLFVSMGFCTTLFFFFLFFFLFSFFCFLERLGLGRKKITTGFKTQKNKNKNKNKKDEIFGNVSDRG